jgi:pSer/pThr/pTyr-binding forkhead associated (FHA) protein
MRFCKFCGVPLPHRLAQPSASASASASDSEPQYHSFHTKTQDQALGLVAEHAGIHPELTQEPAEDFSNSTGSTTGQYLPFSGSSSLPAGRLVIIGSDGQEGLSFPLLGDQIDIGRSEGAITLADDKYMSPRHARILKVNGSWILRDLNSTNGVFFRLREPHQLTNGDLVLLGVEVLRFSTVMDEEQTFGPAVQHGTLVFGSPTLPRPARLEQRTVEGVTRDVYHLHRLETVIGRESGDIVFTDDPYMSRRHAAIRRSSSSGSMTLIDLNSSNGTFIAIRGDWALQDGDSIRMGQHLFRVELSSG